MIPMPYASFWTGHEKVPIWPPFHKRCGKKFMPLPRMKVIVQYRYNSHNNNIYQYHVDGRPKLHILCRFQIMRHLVARGLWPMSSENPRPVILLLQIWWLVNLHPLMALKQPACIAALFVEVAKFDMIYCSMKITLWCSSSRQHLAEALNAAIFLLKSMNNKWTIAC